MKSDLPNFFEDFIYSGIHTHTHNTSHTTRRSITKCRNIKETWKSCARLIILRNLIYKCAKQRGEKRKRYKLFCKNRLHRDVADRVLHNERRKTRHPRTFNDLERIGLAMHLEITASRRREGCYCPSFVQFELVSPLYVHDNVICLFNVHACTYTHTHVYVRAFNFSQMSIRQW